jgi:hypothetical protein
LSARSEWDAKYNRSEKGRARYQRYRDTAKGQKNDRVQHLTRFLTRLKETTNS